MSFICIQSYETHASIMNKIITNIDMYKTVIQIFDKLFIYTPPIPLSYSSMYVGL